MKLLLLIALVLCVYIVWFNFSRIRAIRQEQCDKQNLLNANWETFARAMELINQRKMEFLAGLTHLTEDQRKELWMPVTDKTALACRFFLNHDFARSMAQLNFASNTAEEIISRGKAA